MPGITTPQEANNASWGAKGAALGRGDGAVYRPV